jgi:hypothetical protein
MNEVNKRKMYFLWFRPIVYNGADLRELRNMVFNDTLNVRLHFWGNITSRNLFKQRALSRRQVLAEFSFPLGDLVYRDRIQLEPV